MATAIEFDHVGKQYRLGVVSMGTLGNDLKRWWTTSVLGKEDPFLKVGEVNDRSVKGESEYVWALKDIETVVQFLTEHNVAYALKADNAHKTLFTIKYREEVAL